jgi:large subunit ribosomal protein L5
MSAEKSEKTGKAEKGEKAEKAEKAPKASVKAAPARLRERYGKEILPALMKEIGCSNAFEVPRLEKIVLNMGLGEALQNVKLLDSAVEELSTITGQKPVVTKARKAIANFKLREGVPIGTMVTLRGDRMYEFFDRLVSVALPRVRDFKGLSDRSFDGRGNYSLGLREQIIFPEINLDKIDKVKGLTISIITTARTDNDAKMLLRALGFPFRN